MARARGPLEDAGTRRHRTPILDTTIRLRIATRIHFALLRHYNEDVAVTTLLRGGDEAREALWVCEASGHDELASLGRQFATATRREARAAQLREQEARAQASVAAPQDLAWSRDTSGFGMSRLSETVDAIVPKTASWLKPSSWLGATARRPR